jgi:hypothetical protein
VTIVFPRPPLDESLDILLGSNAAFFRANRNLTHLYIAENPVEVVLVPNALVQTPSGGRDWLPGPARSSQTCRLIESTGQQDPGSQKGADGFQVEQDYQLMLEWDATIGLHDKFTLQGRSWDVIDLMPENGYERRAVVRRYA